MPKGDWDVPVGSYKYQASKLRTHKKELENVWLLAEPVIYNWDNWDDQQCYTVASDKVQLIYFDY